MTTAPSSILKSPLDGSPPSVAAPAGNKAERRMHKAPWDQSEIDIKIDLPGDLGRSEDKALPKTRGRMISHATKAYRAPSSIRLR